MTDFVEALEAELRRAAERRARGAGRPWRSRRPPRLLPAAAIVVALGIGLALVLAVRPDSEERTPPAATIKTATPPPDPPRPAAPKRLVPSPGPALPRPADVSRGARHSKL